MPPLAPEQRGGRGDVADATPRVFAEASPSPNTIRAYRSDLRQLARWRDRIPVVAGVCGSEAFRSIPRFLRTIRDAGFSGVQNYPTVCLFDGIVRANLEETGLGFDKEVDTIREAHALDLFTAAYVLNPDEAEAMADAGADVVVPHMGLTTSGMIGAQTALTLDDAKHRVAVLRDAARGVREDVIVVCHGGPIAGPEEAVEVIRDVAGVQRFLGASSMERLPTEIAMTEHMRRYTRIELPTRAKV